MPVAFEELFGSPKMSYSDGGKITLTRLLQCDWNQTLYFFAELIGGYSNVGGTFVYTPPAVFPGVPFAVVQDIEIEPFPEDNIVTPSGAINVSTNQYLKAKFTVKYGMQDSDSNQSRKDLPTTPDGTRLTYSHDFGAEYLTIPGKEFVWYGPGDVVDSRTIDPRTISHMEIIGPPTI